jgi:hypothetical protein
MASFLGFVDDAGHFALDNRAAFKAALQKFKGYEVVLKLTKRPRMQGTQSMRYYRGVVIPAIATACGYIDADQDECEQVHSGLAWKFLRLPDGPFGEPRRQSTSKGEMSQEEMTAYIDKVVMWAETSIPDCQIPRPDDVDWEKVA